MFMSPLDIVFDEYNVVQPDVVFFNRQRAATIELRQVIRVPPDLAVEVLSPGTEQTDRGRKLRLLARFAVPEYWLVDPIARTIEQLALAGESYALVRTAGAPDTLASTALPALVVSVARVFAD